MWALRPEALESDTLAEVLTRLADRWSRASGITAEVTLTGDARRLAPEVEVTLLRATQEALAAFPTPKGCRRC